MRTLIKKSFGTLLTLFLCSVPGVAQAAISFVGSCENSAGGGGDVTLTLPATDAGDLVIVTYGIGDADGVDFNMTVASPASTFTEEADLFSNDTQDISFGVYWDITDDSYTQVTVDGLGGADAAAAAVCMVFRGVDSTTPMDVDPTADAVTGLSSFSPDPPSLDHNNPSGVWTVIAGSAGHTLGSAGTFTFPTGYTTDGLEAGANDTSDVTTGMGYRSSGVSDPENPGAMTHSGTNNAGFAWAAATLALRPAVTAAPTVTTDTETNVTPISATINGNISDTGGSNATERGFAWGTDSTLSSVFGTSSESGSFSTGTFFENVGGLIAGTTYYYRAYATSPNGTGYGQIESLVAGIDGRLSRAIRLFQNFTVKLYSGRIVMHGIDLSARGAFFTGGTVTEQGGYRYHTFTSDGTLTMVSPGTVEILAVGGGGGGGRFGADPRAGGGGGGEVIETTGVSVSSSLSITIGAGGAGRTSSNGDGTSGNNTVVSGGASYTADGGGGGSGTSGGSAPSGGSGGGGASSSTGSAGGASTASGGGLGNAGGSGVTSGVTSERAAGGGGGATAAGEDGAIDGTGLGGDGGDGYLGFDGNRYGAGGGGGGSNGGGTGGAGGGGDGGTATGAGSPATGNGNGGGGSAGNANGGDGSAGIVIVRYAL